jgi:hypothetical protein
MTSQNSIENSWQAALKFLALHGNGVSDPRSLTGRLEQVPV